MEREIIYEPHPVTPERKAELRAHGYKIIDAMFAPETVDVPMPVQIEVKVTEPAHEEGHKRSRKAKG